MKKTRLNILLLCAITIIIAVVVGLMFYFNKSDLGWDVEEYKILDDIISVNEITVDSYEDVRTYKIMYKSDDYKVASYLSVPKECLENQEQFPCIIYNRGGNNLQSASAIGPEKTAAWSSTMRTITFASQYRGVDGGSGMEEFGGAELNDVIKLIDFCEEFAFVNSDEIYMVGESRGGMMAYLAIRQDERIKKAIIISGIADTFMHYEERPDMKKIYVPLVGGTPDELPEEYEKRSATYWADEIKCPVLIFHSKLDPRVSFAQAEKMAQCLEAAGKEYKFVTYEDDRHGLHQEDVEIMLEWIK